MAKRRISDDLLDNARKRISDELGPAEINAVTDYQTALHLATKYGFDPFIPRTMSPATFAKYLKQIFPNLRLSSWRL